MDNSIFITKKLFDELNVPYTNQYITDCVLSHPEHPSLLAIADTLEKYKIESLAVNIDIEKLEEVPLPCIVQVITRGTELFNVLKKFSNDGAVYLDEKNKETSCSKEEFKNIWTGICLLVEKSKDAKEIGIERKLAAKKILNFLKISLAALLTAWAALLFSRSEIIGDLETALYVLGYSVLKIVGLVVGTFLLWYEVDKYNPTLQSFCTGGKKVDCNSVLNSKYAQLFNGALSLSLIGFSYFFGTLIYLVINGFSFASTALLSFLSFAALPAVIVSVYHQAVVIGQWCKFCIIIQIVLITEIILGFIGGLYKTDIALETLPLFVALLIIPVLSWKLIRPLLEKEKEANLYKRGLKKIKGNPYVLKGLLGKTRKIKTSTKGMGIVFKNEKANYDVIKVCNPYCRPCAEAHPILHSLVKKGLINLQILFTAKVDNERMATPVRHFLALDSLGDQLRVESALDDWYNAENKDYEAFANVYPLSEGLADQDDKIARMRVWCDTENISYTPTLFVNGHELPKEYNVGDLKEAFV